MMPYIQYGLGIYDDKVMVWFFPKEGAKEQRREIKSVEDFNEFMLERAKIAKCSTEDFIIMCSSSMDFPEEETKNKNTIKLARELRIQ